MDNWVITKDQYEAIAKKANYALRKSKNKNPIEIAKALGAEVQIIELNNDLPAFIDKTEGNIPIIYINKKADSYSRKILCAHELGHLMLESRDSLSLFDSEIEPVKEFYANLFAMNIFPQAFIRCDMENMKTIIDFNEYVVSQIMMV